MAHINRRNIDFNCIIRYIWTVRPSDSHERLVVRVRLVVSSEDVTPVPIPNTEVKLFSADDSGFAAKVGHRQDKAHDRKVVFFVLGGFPGEV